MLRALIIPLMLVLSGCLTTSKPVLTPENATPAGESPAFMAYVDAWEAAAGPEDSPREVANDGGLVVDLDGQILIQEIKPGGGAEYYSIGMMGGRPMACFAHDAEMQPIADRHGVTLKIDRDDDDDEIAPAPVHADGTVEALHAFVMDVFRTGTLTCTAFPTKRQGG